MTHFQEPSPGRTTVTGSEVAHFRKHATVQMEKRWRAANAGWKPAGSYGERNSLHLLGIAAFPCIFEQLDGEHTRCFAFHMLLSPET